MLARYQFDLDDVQVDDHRPTGTVQVALDDQGVPAFDIREDVAYDYIDLEEIKPVHIPETRLIYFGTLAQRSDQAYVRFERLLSRKEKNTKTFCDINLRPPHIRQDVIESALRHSDVLKLNTEELFRIGRFFQQTAGETQLVRYLKEKFNIEMVVLTKGNREAWSSAAKRSLTPLCLSPAELWIPLVPVMLLLPLWQQAICATCPCRNCLPTQRSSRPASVRCRGQSRTT